MISKSLGARGHHDLQVWAAVQVRSKYFALGVYDYGDNVVPGPVVTFESRLGTCTGEDLSSSFNIDIRIGYGDTHAYIPFCFR
jgi:hypothetical protein